MIEIFNENEVSIENIADYMVKVGFLNEAAKISRNCIEVVIKSDLSYFILICEADKCISIETNFRLEAEQTNLLRHAIKEALWYGPVFFSMSSIDKEETCFQCLVTYEYGLLPKQFISAVKRFENYIKNFDLYTSGNIESLVLA